VDTNKTISTKYEVPAKLLRRECNPDLFDFECTKDLAPLREFIGQDRAINAINFGLAMNHDGYNIYVAGLTGTGKTSAVKTYLSKIIDGKKVLKQARPPLDWCYIHNFVDADRPQIITLPQGKGKLFEDQIKNLMNRLKDDLTKAFSSEDYVEQRKKSAEESQEAQQKLLMELRDEAQEQGFMLQVTSSGPAFFPIANGKPMSQEEFLALSEEERKKLEEKRAELVKKLESTYEKAQELEKQTAEKIMNVDKNLADNIVSRRFAELIEEYSDHEQISQYLSGLKSYVLENLDIFKATEEKAEQTMLGLSASFLARGRDPFLPFNVNVFVDNSETKGFPVIIEPHPNYANLFGKIERRFLLGGYLSDHTMLKPGSLHMANGGYLVLNATDVLTSPAVWPALKRAIKTKEVRIEDPFEQFGLIAPQGLKPQPVPLDVKVIMIGDGMVYQMLSLYDEDFWEIFKVKADFDYQVDRNKANMMHYAAFISGCCEDCDLIHFDRTGVAKVVDYASRMVADQEKLSSRFAVVKEMVEEAEHWARMDGSKLVSGEHVTRAINERYFRHNLPEQRIRELIERGTIMIDIDGEVAGQVNGLSVYSLGDISFGRPSRITCQTFMGRSGLINIERESQLSGKIHDKGVLILSGYLGWKYAQESPLSLSASLCFEQSYEGIDGDSASSTELYALLSSLTDIPIKQNIAVTGSVNQRGEIQPIGGVNQKIEGFFRVCEAKGLNGEQGVMIPRKNLKNLMLRQEVVDAVNEGKFHIYSVSTIDEGIEVLTGVKAGKKKKDGTYPKDSINSIVDRKLKDMAKKLKQFYGPEEGQKKKSSPKK
jgi:lon-related putative ATP-dependent protease